MRALLDPNVLISYLLIPLGNSPVNVSVDVALAGTFTLLLPEEVLEEVVRVAASKPYLAQRIAPESVEALLRALAAVAEVVPALDEEIPAIGRDRKDDYLLAYAAVGQADYLVSGDNDLLSLGEVAGIRIVSPAAFVAILAAQGRLPHNDQ